MPRPSGKKESSSKRSLSGPKPQCKNGYEHLKLRIPPKGSEKGRCYKQCEPGQKRVQSEYVSKADGKTYTKFSCKSASPKVKRSPSQAAALKKQRLEALIASQVGKPKRTSSEKRAACAAKGMVVDPFTGKCVRKCPSDSPHRNHLYIVRPDGKLRKMSRCEKEKHQSPEMSGRLHYADLSLIKQVKKRASRSGSRGL